jgi:hypothetical protein
MGEGDVGFARAGADVGSHHLAALAST